MIGVGDGWPRSGQWAAGALKEKQFVMNSPVKQQKMLNENCVFAQTTDGIWSLTSGQFRAMHPIATVHMLNEPPFPYVLVVVDCPVDKIYIITSQTPQM